MYFTNSISGSGDFPPYDNNNEPRLKKQRGRKKRKVETGSAFAAINGYLDAASAAAAAASGGAFPVDGNSKTKRARTSFKHHQLRIMKAHFQVNQNPDSRELKMLSQKTGLDKKVLQVRGEGGGREGGSVYKMLNHAWRVPNLAIHPTRLLYSPGQHLPAAQ